MDKEWFIQFLENEYYPSKLSLGNVSKLLTSYCEDHKDRLKTPDSIGPLVNYVINSPFLEECIKVAIKHYKSELGCIEVLRIDPNSLNVYRPITIF